MAEPAETAVTKPALVTVATPAAELAHVPPELGVRLVVCPIHNVFDPANTVGPGLIVNPDVVF